MKYIFFRNKFIINKQNQISLITNKKFRYPKLNIFAREIISR